MRLPSLLAAGVTLAASAAALGVSSAASAATGPAPVLATLSACGSGSSATWSGGNAVLTVGTGAAGTCGAPAGSTYNPAYAQEVLQVKGGVVPAPTEGPAFATNNYASGSPRIVIDLGNGHSLWGYPAASGLNGTDMAWAVDNGNTYTSYATAYNTALAYETTVKDAYVVEDADQTPGTSDTITSFTYGGAPVEPMVTLSNGHVVSVNNNRAEVAWTATPAAAEYKVVINGPNFDMRTNVITATAAFYSGLAAGHTYAVYVTPLDANGYAVGSTGDINFVTTG
jgi:hypothetical protein